MIVYIYINDLYYVSTESANLPEIYVAIIVMILLLGVVATGLVIAGLVLLHSEKNKR